MNFFVLLALQLRGIAPDGFLPTTLVGLLTTAGLVIGFGLQFVAMGRFLEKLNGLGERLNTFRTESERRVTALETRETERTLAMERLTIAGQQLLKDITAATVLIQDCHDKDEKMEKAITGRLDTMNRDANVNSQKVGERLAALETATRLTVRLRSEEEHRA